MLIALSFLLYLTKLENIFKNKTRTDKIILRTKLKPIYE